MLITSVCVLTVIFAATVVKVGAHWWISTLAFPLGGNVYVERKIAKII